MATKFTSKLYAIAKLPNVEEEAVKVFTAILPEILVGLGVILFSQGV